VPARTSTNKEEGKDCARDRNVA